MYEALLRRVLGRHGPCNEPGNTSRFHMISQLLPRLRPLLAAAATFALLAFPDAPADAQSKPTIQKIDVTQIRRKQPRREANNFPYWVSQSDCLADDVITFKVQVTTPNTDNLEVWAGAADCTQPMQRQGTTATCWRVFSKGVTKSPADIPIRAQDLVAENSGVLGNTGADGTDADCVPKYQKLGLYFMYVNDSGQISSNSITFNDTGVDTEGPNTPTVTEVLASDKRLIVNWENNNPTEFAGYKIYCSEATETETESASNGLTLLDGAIVDGSVFDTSSSVSTSASANTSEALASSSGVSGSAASDTGTTSGSSIASNVGDAAAAASDGGASTEDGVAGCGGSALKEGTFPSMDLECGTVSTYSSTTGYAKGLINGRSYAVGIAAKDRLGNESKLSNVVCNSPRDVYTFYEDYRAAGGGGGGGFCSLATTPHGSARGQWQALQWLGLIGLGICFGFFRRIKNS